MMTYCVYEYGTGKVKQKGLPLDQALEWARKQLSNNEAMHAVVIMREASHDQK